MTRGPRRLVVDTSVAVYLLPAHAPKGQEAEWREAQELLRVRAEEWTLCLPAPALGEVLASVPHTKRVEAADLLGRMFEILTFDRDAALVVGDIAMAGLRGRAGAKQPVKIDIEIVACALRWDAGGLCVLDGDHAGIVARSGKDLRTGPPSMFAPRQQPISFDEPR